MIDRLFVLLTRIVILLILCVVTDDYPRCMLSNTGRKLRQFTADCAPAQQAQRRHPGTWPRYEVRVCMRRDWMTSIRRSRFARVACSETASI